MIGAALVAALALASQLQTHPTGLPSVGPSRANSLRTAPIMDKLYEQAGKPALDFDFARYKDLHDNASGKTSLVTFSRSAAQSPGTYVGSDGLIHDAAVNLALYSEQFDNAVWTKSGADIAANQIIAPDGKQTADEIRAKAITTSLGIYGTGASLASGTTYTFSTYIKYINHQWIWIRGDRPSTAWQAFDIQNGAVGNKYDPVGVISNPSIQDVGNGWYRVSFSMTTTSSGVSNIVYTLGNGSTPTNSSVTTLGTERMGVWGAQLEETDASTMAPTAYIKTTSQALAAPRFDHDPVTGESLGLLVEEQRANLLVRSEEFDLVWGSNNVGEDANVAVAPDGTMTADKIKPNTANTAAHYITQTISTDGTFTIYAKAGEYDKIMLWNTGANKGRGFDLTNGTTFSTGLADAPSYSITDVGNGWYRCLIYNTGITAAQIYIFASASYSAYQGNDSDGVYLWGAQLENATFPTSYIPTVTSQTRYADVAAVQDEDFSTTNLLAYSESFDVGWLLNGIQPFGSGSVANDIASPDGQTTADKVVEDATGAQHFVGSAMTFSTGYHTATFFAKAAGRSVAQLAFSGATGLGGNGYANFDLQNGVVSAVGTGLHASMQDMGNGWYLCRVGANFSSGGYGTHAIFIQNSTSAVRGASYAGDGTSGIYLWGASLTATEYPVEYTTTRNLLTDSQDFERGAWTKTAATIGNDVAQAPDGTLTADKLIATSSGGLDHYVSVNISGGSSTLSVYAKAAEKNFLNLRGVGSIETKFDLTTGSVNGTGSAEDVGNGWWRCSVPISGFTQVRIQIANSISSNPFAGDDTSGIYVWGAQLEPGTTATDYVRTVDVVGKDYGWYEPTEGTFLASGKPDEFAIGGFIGLGAGTGTIYKQGNTAVRALSWWNGTTSLVTANTIDWTTTIGYAAAAYTSDSRHLVLNGGAVATNATTLPIGDKIRIGQGYTGGGNVLNGHIKRLTYWPRRQSDSTLQVITQ